MLLMPRIHRRQIERLKSNRSIRVHATERIKPQTQQPMPTYDADRRIVRERRKRSLPVAVERRRGDRRNRSRRLRPEIRSLLENSGANNDLNPRREGVYVNEDV